MALLFTYCYTRTSMNCIFSYATCGKETHRQKLGEKPHIAKIITSIYMRLLMLKLRGIRMYYNYTGHVPLP